MFVYLVFSTAVSALFLYPSIAFMSNDIRSGNIVTLLVKPMDYQMQYICKQGGIFLFMLCILVPLVVVICFVQGFAPRMVHIVYFLLSIVLGFFFLTTFDFLLGTLCFWTENGWGIISLKTVLFDFLSGGLVPLDLLPGSMQKFMIEFMPFSKVVYAPIMILQGKYIIKDILLQYVALIIWTLSCYVLGKRMLHRAYKTIISNGG